MRILICGLPGSGKTTLAEPFAELINGIWINADKVRTRYDDQDFTVDGRVKQAYRMRHLADGVQLAGKIAVADFVCPTNETRDIFNADYTIWMDTIKEGRFNDTNLIFENPKNYNYHVREWFYNTHKELLKVESNYMEKQK